MLLCQFLSCCVIVSQWEGEQLCVQLSKTCLVWDWLVIDGVLNSEQLKTALSEQMVLMRSELCDSWCVLSECCADAENASQLLLLRMRLLLLHCGG